MLEMSYEYICEFFITVYSVEYDLFYEHIYSSLFSYLYFLSFKYLMEFTPTEKMLKNEKHF